MNRHILPYLPALLLAPDALAQSAEQQTVAAIARVEALNPRVNAVIALFPDAQAEARALDLQRKARGALHGMPILLKDNIEAKGPLPTTAGSLALLPNVTGRDAPLVARLRASGAVILGKTNLSEWANFRSNSSISGWSGVGGQTRNPHALNRNPCGSSSGSGAAVASGMVDAAIGTETNGSIICPASVAGIVGLKPTVGLVSRSRIIPISASQDTAGPMAKDVATAARVLTAIAGSDPTDPATAEADARKTDYSAGLATASLKGVRIGVLRFATGWSPPVDAAFAEALALLEREGAILVAIEKGPDTSAIGQASFQVLLTEFKAGVNAYLATTPATVSTRTLADVIAFNSLDPRELALFDQSLLILAEATKGLEDPAYKEARVLSLRLAGPEGIDAMLATHKVEALVSPSAPAAWPIDAVNGDHAPFGGAGSLAAVAGTPNLTVPMGQRFGLPIGLSFMGAKWSEARLLALGAAYERARGPLPPATLSASVEEKPEVAKLLAPAPR